MNVLRLFILLQALFTLFIAGGLFFKYNTVKNKSIGVFSVLFSLEIFYFLYGTSKIAGSYPELYGRYYFSAGLMYGPIFYIHFKSFIQNEYKFKLIDFWHFFPLLIFNIYVFDLSIMSNTERIEYYNNIENFYNHILPLNYFRAIHQIIYGIILSRFFLINKNKLSVNSKFYLGGLSFIYIIITIVISLLILFANSWRDFSLYYLISTSVVFLIAFLLYKDPKFFKALKLKYEYSQLTNSEMVLLKDKIELLFKTETVYLNSNLTIGDLARQLNTKSHHLSQTFTKEIQENFNDFVNKYRIEYSKTLLKSSKHKNLKIEAIAEESGFNNKVTFYKAFSKFEGTTPSKYRKIH